MKNVFQDMEFSLGCQRLELYLFYIKYENVMKCQTMFLLILQGARMFWYNKLQKSTVCKSEQYQTWTQMEWFEQYFLLRCLPFNLWFTNWNVLHFDSNKSLDSLKWAPKRGKMVKKYVPIMFIYFYLLFYHSWTICLQENICQIMVILEPYMESKFESLHSVHTQNSFVLERTHTKTAQFSDVISRCVHTLVSIRYRWANSFSGSQPASDLHNIPEHTLRERCRHSP